MSAHNLLHVLSDVCAGCERRTVCLRCVTCDALVCVACSTSEARCHACRDRKAEGAALEEARAKLEYDEELRDFDSLRLFRVMTLVMVGVAAACVVMLTFFEVRRPGAVTANRILLLTTGVLLVASTVLCVKCMKRRKRRRVVVV